MMAKHMVTVRATYVQELVVEADDDQEVRRVAMREFAPNSDNLFSMDVFGPDPWQPIGDPHADDKYMDEMRGAG